MYYYRVIVRGYTWELVPTEQQCAEITSENEIRDGYASITDKKQFSAIGGEKMHRVYGPTHPSCGIRNLLMTGISETVSGPYRIGRIAIDGEK